MKKLGLICIGIGALFIFSAINSNLAAYSGKVVFSTEEEYAAFKQAMASPDVTYSPENVSVLSSSPPIVASFVVYTYNGHVFPYGEKGATSFALLLFGLGIIMVFVGLVIMVLWFLEYKGIV